MRRSPSPIRERVVSGWEPKLGMKDARSDCSQAPMTASQTSGKLFSLSSDTCDLSIHICIYIYSRIHRRQSGRSARLAGKRGAPPPNTKDDVTGATSGHLGPLAPMLCRSRTIYAHRLRELRPELSRLQGFRLNQPRQNECHHFHPVRSTVTLNHCNFQILMFSVHCARLHTSKNGILCKNITTTLPNILEARHRVACTRVSNLSLERALTSLGTKCPPRTAWSGDRLLPPPCSVRSALSRSSPSSGSGWSMRRRSSAHRPPGTS